MADLSKIKLNNITYNLKDDQARSQIGTLSSLNTTVKSNLVAAINEVASNSGGNASNNNSTFDTEWENIYCDWQGGYYYDPDNNYAYTQISSTEKAWNTTELYISVSCTPYNNMIAVKPGETYRYYNMPVHFDSKNAEVPSVIIFDSNKDEIISYTRTFNDSNETYFTIPSGGVWMAVLYANNQEYTLQKQVAKRHTQQEILNDINSHYRSYCLTAAPTKNTLSKAYFCIGTDDLRANETKNLHTMLTTNNIPYYIAAVPENVKKCVTDDPYKTNLDYMRLCVANGGEIVCHSAVGLNATNKNNFDVKYQYFYEGKRELESYGFTVRGIFKAGDDNAIGGADPVIDPWAVYYYDFSDDFTTAFPYQNGRTLLDAWETYDNLGTAVQNIVTNHGYAIYAFHWYDQDAETALSTILTALSGYTRGTDYDFVTPSQLYELLMPTTRPSGSGGGIDTNTTYSLSMTNNRIILTPSSGTASYVDLPVYTGGVS